MNNHSTELALAFLNASPVPRIVGELRLWIADALDACPAGIPATPAPRARRGHPARRSA